jgi:hypothetical protein
MARAVFEALRIFDARLFASVIPRTVVKPEAFHAEEYLRKDHVFLLERYFTKTQTGRYRTAWIVPVPMFVASDMTMAVQAADLAIYCVNWGFRLPLIGMNESTRADIANEFGPWLKQLQYQGEGRREGRVFDTYGIVFVPNPYGDGRA